MNNLRRSYGHRNNLKLLELSIDPTKCTKILRGSYDVITAFVRPPYEARVSYDVKQNLGQDHRLICDLTNGLRKGLRTLFSYGLLKKTLRNGLKIVRTAFVAARKGICDRGFR